MFLQTLIFFSCAAAVLSATSFGSTPVVDGKCQYDEKLLETDVPTFDEENCLMYSCYIEDSASNEGFVSIITCGSASVISEGEDCTIVPTTGVYPKCCFGFMRCGDKLLPLPEQLRRRRMMLDQLTKRNF